MKLEIEISMEPEEVRRLLGLPDMQPLHESYITQLERMMKQGVTVNTARDLVKDWTSVGEKGVGFLTSLFGNSVREALKNAAAPLKSAAKSETKSEVKPEAKPEAKRTTSPPIKVDDIDTPRQKISQGIKAKNQKKQNNVPRPMPGTVRAMAWEICDAMQAVQGGRLPPRMDVVAEAERQGLSGGSANKEYYQWKKFHGF